MKLTRKHIAHEYADNDGYWIELKRGWKNASDPVGVLHTIREDTKKAAYRETVIPCDCKDCK